MTATETNGQATADKNSSPAARLRKLTETIVNEYNALVTQMRPGQINAAEIGEITDQMQALASAAHGSVGTLLLLEIRNLATPDRRLPDLVFTYRLPADPETHCIFDYHDEKAWAKFSDRYADKKIAAERNPFDPQQQFRIYFKMKDNTPGVGVFNGTYEEYQKQADGRCVIIDAILI